MSLFCAWTDAKCLCLLVVLPYYCKSYGLWSFPQRVTLKKELGMLMPYMAVLAYEMLMIGANGLSVNH